MPLKDRQGLMINRLLDGFEGKLTSAKWAAIARSSHVPRCAIRQLVERDILIKNASGGRSSTAMETHVDC